MLQRMKKLAWLHHLQLRAVMNMYRNRLALLPGAPSREHDEQTMVQLGACIDDETP